MDEAQFGWIAKKVTGQYLTVVPFMLHPLSSLGYNFSQRKGHNVSNLTFPTPQKCKEPCPLLCAETFLFFVPVWAKCGSRKRPGTCVKITRGTSVLPCFHESRVHVHASFFWETKEMKNWFAVGYAVSTELNVSSYLLGVSGFDGTSTKPWKNETKAVKTQDLGLSREHDKKSLTIS